jgi:hypothetical protein
MTVWVWIYVFSSMMLLIASAGKEEMRLAAKERKEHKK